MDHHHRTTGNTQHNHTQAKRDGCEDCAVLDCGVCVCVLMLCVHVLCVSMLCGVSHWGDLGNVTADAAGVVTFDERVSYNTDFLSLWQSNNTDVPWAHNIIGRGIVFHQNADNGSSTSYGARPFGGVIGQQHTQHNNKAQESTTQHSTAQRTTTKLGVAQVLQYRLSTRTVHSFHVHVHVYV